MATSFFSGDEAKYKYSANYEEHFPYYKFKDGAY